MKVLVDTSVWADFFNQQSTREADLLARLIQDEVELVTCGVVIAEFLQGIRRESSLAELERQFRDMECLTPREPDSYLTAARMYRQLRARGITVRSTIDCLIVTLAAEHDVLLLARDRDLRQILDAGVSEASSVPFGGD